MSTVEEHLAKLASSNARVDERTIAILENQEDFRNRLEAHEEVDRLAFLEVGDRLGRVENNQRWYLRLGAFIGTAGIAVIGFMMNRGGDL
jgi:hypothetical protein